MYFLTFDDTKCQLLCKLSVMIKVLHYSDVIMSAMASQITGVPGVYCTVCSSADQRIHQSSASLAFVRRIHRWPVDSPHKGPVTRKMFSFDDVIMLPHAPKEFHHSDNPTGMCPHHILSSLHGDRLKSSNKSTMIHPILRNVLTLNLASLFNGACLAWNINVRRTWNNSWCQSNEYVKCVFKYAWFHLWLRPQRVGEAIGFPCHGPLTRYGKLRVVHAPGTVSPPPNLKEPRLSDPGMHHGTCVTHVSWCMSGSLTRGAGKMFLAFPVHAQPTILRIV